MLVSLKVTVYGEKYGVLSHEVLLKNRSRTVYFICHSFSKCRPHSKNPVCWLAAHCSATHPNWRPPKARKL